MEERGEQVLAMSGGGCSVRFYRRPVAGGFLYHQEVAMARGVDEDGDLVWNNDVGDPISSFDELLLHVRGWMMLSPVQVHPDHTEAVWGLVQKVMQEVSGPTQELFRTRMGRWRELCRPAAG